MRRDRNNYFGVVCCVYLASCSAPATLTQASAGQQAATATATDLIAALHPTSAGDQALVAQAIAQAGAMRLSELYAAVGQSSVSSATLDNMTLSNPWPQLQAERTSVEALDSHVPNLNFLFERAHVDPLAITAESLRADAEAVTMKLRERSTLALADGTKTLADHLQKCADANEFASNIGLIVAGVCTALTAVELKGLRAINDPVCLAWDGGSMVTWALSTNCSAWHDIVTED